MKLNQKYPFIVLFFFSTIAILVLITSVNYQYSVQNPGGSDFLPRWVGTRNFVTKGISPYSREITLEIQQRFYGRPARPDEDQVLFVYPFYSIFIFAPFALIPDYEWARAIWMTTLEISIILIIIIGISLSQWKLNPLKFGLVLIFGFLWYYSIRPLINANASVLVSTFIIASLLAIRAGRDFWVGILLAFSTIKPQMVLILILFVLIWSISKRRFVIIWSFLGSMILLFVVTSLMIPNWVTQNVSQILAYPGYTLPGSLGAILSEWVPGFGRQLGMVITIILTFVLLWKWYAALSGDFPKFLWTAFLSLALTTMIGLRIATENYIVLLPAVIFMFSIWDQERIRLGRVMIAFSYSLLLFGIWWLFLTTLERGEQPLQHSIMFFPLPVFLIICLIWFENNVKKLSWSQINRHGCSG